jgi:hypothetical protein
MMPAGMRTVTWTTFVALLVELFRDIVVGDRAEQTAIHAGLLGQLEDCASQLLALGLGFSQLGCCGFFEFGALGLELSLGRRGRTTSTAGRESGSYVRNRL